MAGTREEVGVHSLPAGVYTRTVFASLPSSSWRNCGAAIARTLLRAQGGVAWFQLGEAGVSLSADSNDARNVAVAVC